jgi:hypothetical protein
MRCFYHQDQDGVGICKSCGKGLCPDCAVDVGKGLACRGRCEEDVRAVIALVDRNLKLAPQTARLLDSSRKIRSSTATFNLVIGAIFIAWGLTDVDRLGFIIVLGICLLAYGIFALFQARKLAKERQET